MKVSQTEFCWILDDIVNLTETMCSLYSLPPISIKLELLSRRPTRRKPLETPESSQAIIGSWNVPPDAVLPSWSPRKFAAFIITIALLAAGLLAFDLLRTRSKSASSPPTATPRPFNLFLGSKGLASPRCDGSAGRQLEFVCARSRLRWSAENCVDSR